MTLSCELPSFNFNFLVPSLGLEGEFLTSSSLQELSSISSNDEEYFTEKNWVNNKAIFNYAVDYYEKSFWYNLNIGFLLL